MTELQIVSPTWIVPVIPHNVVLTNHSLIIKDNKIETLLPTPEAKAQYPSASELMLDQHALLPGLINVHTHAAMTLLRGYADDLTLMDWLNNHIWPVENQFVDEAFVYDGLIVEPMS